MELVEQLFDSLIFDCLRPPCSGSTRDLTAADMLKGGVVAKGQTMQHCEAKTW